MKCENCGNEVREGAKFCSKCGSNILEQQEDHSGKHNVHETKTEKRCVNCGNVLREESKFCPKCGSSTVEQKEDVSTLKDEEKDKAEQSKGTFYFEKVKMIGRLRYKIIRTEVSNNEERLEISQKIHRFLRKEKENHLEIKLSEIGSMELKTKMDFWDTLYAALFGVMFLMNITDVACARCTGVFIGEVLGIFLFEVGEISNIIAVVFSLIMFADWFVQYKFHYESNNIRRLITGLLCGYAFGNIIMKYLKYFM